MWKGEFSYRQGSSEKTYRQGSSEKTGILQMTDFTLNTIKTKVDVSLDVQIRLGFGIINHTEFKSKLEMSLDVQTGF